MARPPFALHVRLPRRRRSARVRVVLAERADKGENPLTGEPYTLKPSVEIVRIFAQAVNAQLLNDHELEPVARMRTVQEEKTGEGPVFVYDTEGVSADAYLVLLALLAQTCYAGDPLQSLVIEAEAASDDDLDAAALCEMASEVPRRPQALPFRYSDENASRRYHVISFEFAGAVLADVYLNLEEKLVIWDNLLVLGGFRLDFVEEEDLRGFGTLAHISPSLVEYTLDPFLEYRSAVHSLMVLAKNLHLAGHPLASLTIE